MAVAAAAQGDVLRAVAAARDRRLVEPVLVADGDDLARVADEEGIDISGMAVEDVADPEAASRRAVSIVAAGDHAHERARRYLDAPPRGVGSREGAARR